MAWNHNRWTETDYRMLHELFGNMPLAEIAERMGRTTEAVGTRARALGLKRYDRLLNVPVGTERYTTERGLIRKVQESGTTRQMWKRVTTLEWEKAHGPLPPNTCVRKKDPSKPETLDNLMLVRLAEIGRQAHISRGLPPSPELDELKQLRKKLVWAIRDRERSNLRKAQRLHTTECPSTQSAST